MRLRRWRAESLANGIGNGTLPFMNAIAEIDKAGRVVVPKKMREALHLVPGTRLTLRQDGDSIVLEPEVHPRGLYVLDGWPVFDGGGQGPVDVTDWLAQDREERLTLLSQRPAKR